MTAFPPPPPGLPEILRPELERSLQALAEGMARDGIAPSRLPEGLCRVLAASPFAARTLARSPGLLADLMASGDLEGPYAPGGLAARVQAVLGAPADESALMAALRRVRAREMARIAWRDLAGAATLDETLGDLTDLAEACIDAAHERLHAWLSERHGAPVGSDGRTLGLAVLGMGKLGGRELNFSSDIDLIFAYAEDGETGGSKPIEHHAFFTRLGQQLIRVLNEQTADGFVFRVDIRLRPFGDTGPLVMSHDAMEVYYQTHGREWERYALIKARPVGGDREAGGVLLDTLRPFIYRRYLDYGSFAALRDMKVLINREAARKGMAGDIKRGEGGIREVEFIGQAFQLIRGGRDTGLRERGIRQVLAVLGAQGLLPEWAVRQVLEAYAFLRRTENRIQEMEDRQTHNLPREAVDRARLAFAMGYCEPSPSPLGGEGQGERGWKAFHAELTRHMRQVHDQFEQVFAAPQGEDGREDDAATKALSAAWRGTASRERAAETLSHLGFAVPDAALDALDGLRDSPAVRALTGMGRERLDALMPLLVAACAGNDRPDETLIRLLDLVRAIARRSVYLSLLVESPMALSQLARLCAASPWIAGELTRHPILLDELLDPRALYSPPGKEGIAAELREELTHVPEDDLEQLMDRLRAFKQAQVLRVAAADVAGALPVMKVSDHLTWIAEALLEAVLATAWRQVAVRHGVPHGVSPSPQPSPHGGEGAAEGEGDVSPLPLAGQMRGERIWSPDRAPPKGRAPGMGQAEGPGVRVATTPGFAVIGYGKLGGLELGYGSDLDLVFLYDGDDEAETVGGERPLSTTEFFARLAQRALHLLGAHTPAGILYEVDTRLRPSGASGLLVSSLAAFERYQRESAWTWEHQALVRARPVAGDPAVGEGFSRIRAATLSRARDLETLRREVREMREKMWTELGAHDAARFDLKRDSGGIADIEFMVQYLALAYAAEHPRLVEFPDNIRILDGLSACGQLPAEEARFLADTYRTFRDRIHALTLQGQSAAVPAEEYVEARQRVRDLWRRLMGQ